MRTVSKVDFLHYAILHAPRRKSVLWALPLASGENKLLGKTLIFSLVVWSENLPL